MGRKAALEDQDGYIRVYEYDYSYRHYRVIWVDPTGRYRSSRACETHMEASNHAIKHHPDWPYVIVYEYREETREVRGRGNGS